MGLSFSIKGHKTSKGHLCETCDWQRKRVGDSFKHTLEYCVAFKTRVPCPISECTEFKERGTPDLYEMQRMAWNLLLDKKGGQIGFRSPAVTRQLVDDGKAQEPIDVDE